MRSMYGSPAGFAALIILIGGRAPAQTTDPSLPMSAAHQAIVDSAAVAIWSPGYREELAVDYQASDSTRVIYRIPGRPFELVITVTNDIPSAYYCESCLAYLNEDLPISALNAIAIARDAGLEIGLRAWRVSRHWYYGEIERMVWTVENTLQQYQGTASGRIVVIDAADGTILQSNDGWVEPCEGLRPPVVGNK